MLRSRFKNWLSWQPQPAEFLALMQPVKPWPVQMERYSRGIDNTHIDVLLSRRFLARARVVVRAMVRGDVAGRFRGEKESQARSEDLDEFRDAYRGLVESAMKQRRQLPPADWVRLAQLSLLKCLLLLVPEEIQNLRRHLETARDEEHAAATGRGLEYHERLVVLAREESGITYRVHRRLFRLVEKIETVHLRKLRKSLLGASWPVPREAMFNPLLQLPNLLGEDEVMHHYPVLCVEANGREHLQGLNRCVTGVFKDYLPTWVTFGDSSGDDTEPASEVGGLRIIDRLDQGGLRGFLETEIVLSQLLSEDEYKKSHYCWLDDPENLEQFFEIRRPSTLDREEPLPDRRQEKHWRDFRRSVRDELFRRVEGLDIMPRIVASYWTPRIHQELGGVVSARLIYQYLVGEQTRRRILRRVASAHREADPALVAKTLDFAAGEIRQLTVDSRREYVARLLVDFLSLRRDLKLAYKTFEAMDQLRLLEDEDEINLSRTNGLLYEMKLGDEQDTEQRIINHVILKADVRGSTTITSELRARKLNPATHFSQNFFNPINKYLADYGAGKVFVEGDAVILSIFEYTGDAHRRLGVAHACGLASRILEVVNRQNVINRKHGLPDLELGLGISFCNEEPTFLYDEDRKIMISPAINLADRLSSCSKTLREAPFAKEQRPFRVEVLLPADASAMPACSKTDVLRYNVNGIEIDAAAFDKLKTEVVTYRMEMRLAGQVERFHVGRYPDRTGRMGWLVVRDAPVRMWEGDSMRDADVDGRRFYEVVVDAGLIALIKAKLRSAKEDRGALSPGRGSAAEGRSSGPAASAPGMND